MKQVVPYKKRLLKIFFPIMLSNLISQVQMLIDRIFLGRIDVLNMSAVGNASTPMWTTLSFVFSLSIGASILISHAVGEGNMEKAKQYAASLLKYHNIIPVLLFFFWTFLSPFVYKLMGVSENVMPLCVTYTRYYAPVFLIMGLGSSFIVILQTSNFTKHLISYGIIRSVLNIVLDYLLIFGKFGFPTMGIKGAALATTIAEYGGMLFGIIIFINSKKLTTKPDFKMIFKAEFLPYVRSCQLGVHSALEDFLWNFGNLGLIKILNSINEFAAGIYTIMFSVEILVVVIIGALGNATMTLCGEATGASDELQLKSIVRTSWFWGMCVSAVSVALSLAIPKQILSIFTSDEGIIATSSIYLFLIMFNLFGKSTNIIVGNGVKGYGDTRWMFITQTFGTVFVIGTACLFVYAFNLEIKGVYLAIILDEIIRAIMNSIRFAKIKLKAQNAKFTTE